MTKRAPFRFCEESVAAGEARIIDIPLSNLATHTQMYLPVHITHGRKDGPTLFVSAAIHGDEIIGVEIIRRLLKLKALRSIRGTLMLIPIVNVYGFIAHERHLQDKRDLNRSFPGTTKGSLASQIAKRFMTEVVERSDVGIDIHTALVNRHNLPQIRGDLSKPRVMEMGKAFGAPVLLNSNIRDGSLRQAGQEVGVDILLYESGEGLRFDERSIKTGVRGVLRVMQALGMVSKNVVKPTRTIPVVSQSASWVRAPVGGVVRFHKKLGDQISEGEIIGVVADPFGQTETEIIPAFDGVLIGINKLPVVNQGDALFNIARVSDGEKAERKVGRLEQELESDPVLNPGADYLT